MPRQPFDFTIEDFRGLIPGRGRSKITSGFASKIGNCKPIGGSLEKRGCNIVHEFNALDNNQVNAQWYRRQCSGLFGFDRGVVFLTSNMVFANHDQREGFFLTPIKDLGGSSTITPMVDVCTHAILNGNVWLANHAHASFHPFFQVNVSQPGTPTIKYTGGAGAELLTISDPDSIILGKRPRFIVSAVGRLFLGGGNLFLSQNPYVAFSKALYIPRAATGF